MNNKTAWMERHDIVQLNERTLISNPVIDGKISVVVTFDSALDLESTLEHIPIYKNIVSNYGRVSLRWKHLDYVKISYFVEL